MTSWKVIAGDCVERMRELPAASVDAICTDPPYLISFMGKEFDSQDGIHADPKRMQAWHEAWAREALRVLKPCVGEFIGIERDATYVQIAEARIQWWSEHPDGMTLVKRLEAESARKMTAESGQVSMFDLLGDV